MVDPDTVGDFDDIVPGQQRTATEIEDWLEENTGDTVGENLIEALGDRLEQVREQNDGPAGASGEGIGTVYLDDSGRWRDSETGQFVSPPGDNS